MIANRGLKPTATFTLPLRGQMVILKNLIKKRRPLGEFPVPLRALCALCGKTPLFLIGGDDAPAAFTETYPPKPLSLAISFHNDLVAVL